MKKHVVLLFTALLMAVLLCFPVSAEDVDLNGAGPDPVVLADIANQLPNQVLYQFIKVQYDTNNDNMLTLSEADLVTHIEMVDYDFTDEDFTYVALDGTLRPFNELFRNLDYLVLDRNDLTTLDTSRNLKLRALAVEDNQLVTLTMAEDLYTLEYIDVSGNYLETLSLDTAIALHWLDCSENMIKDLDIYACNPLLTRNDDDEHFYFAVGNQQNTNFTPCQIFVRAHYLQNLFYSDNQLDKKPENKNVLMLQYPYISYSSGNVLTGEGMKPAFSVSAISGEGVSLSYQWQVSTDNGTSWKDCTAASCNTSYYSFTAKPAYSGRVYRCKVSNVAGSVYTEPALLTVIEKPTITKAPTNLAIAENQTAIFSVTADGHGEELFYQWQVKIGTAAWKNCTATGANTPTYSFKAKTAYDGRMYRCRILNNYGNEVTTVPVRLTILPYIEIINQPETITRFGTEERAVFTVEAAATLPLTYLWQVSKDLGHTWTNCTAKGYNTPTYSFNVKKEYSDRYYRCIVSDGISTLYSGYAALVVRAPLPVILHQPTDKTVTAGKKVTFTITAADNGDNVSFKWQVKKSTSSEWVDCTAAGWNTNTYSFTAKASYNGREYRCFIYNSDRTALTVSSAVTLTVK